MLYLCTGDYIWRDSFLHLRRIHKADISKCSIDSHGSCYSIWFELSALYISLVVEFGVWCSVAGHIWASLQNCSWEVPTPDRPGQQTIDGCESSSSSSGYLESVCIAKLNNCDIYRWWVHTTPWPAPPGVQCGGLPTSLRQERPRTQSGSMCLTTPCPLIGARALSSAMDMHVCAYYCLNSELLAWG